ncbi:hypothetical protein D3C77_597540 [compost metagenome]
MFNRQGVADFLQNLLERGALIHEPAMQGSRCHVKQAGGHDQARETVLLLQHDAANASAQGGGLADLAQFALTDQLRLAKGRRIRHSQGQVEQ